MFTLLIIESLLSKAKCKHGFKPVQSCHKRKAAVYLYNDWWRDLLLSWSVHSNLLLYVGEVLYGGREGSTQKKILDAKKNSREEIFFIAVKKNFPS